MSLINVLLCDGCREHDKQTPFNISVLPDENIAQLKRLVYSLTGIEMDKFQLYYEGTPMLENKMIKDYDVKKKKEGTIIEYRRMKEPSPLPDDAPSEKELLEGILSRQCTEEEEKLLDLIEVKEALHLIYQGKKILQSANRNLVFFQPPVKQAEQAQDEVNQEEPPKPKEEKPVEKEEDLNITYKEEIATIKEILVGKPNDQIIAALLENNGDVNKVINMLL